MRPDRLGVMLTVGQLFEKGTVSPLVLASEVRYGSIVGALPFLRHLFAKDPRVTLIVMLRDGSMRGFDNGVLGPLQIQVEVVS